MLNRLELKAIAIFLTLSLLLGGTIWGFQHNLSKQRLLSSIVHDSAAFAGVRIGLRDSADRIALLLQSNPQLITLVKQLAQDPSPAARQQLYEQLDPLHAKLQEHYSRHLSFFAADGQALLRMQRPDLYGDHASDFRPLLRQVLVTREPASGFDFGLFFQAYRFIYPLFDGETLIAAFEVSIGFSALQDALALYAPLHTGFVTLLQREAVLDLIADSPAKQQTQFAKLYSPSSVNPDYVTENLDEPQFSAPAAPPLTDDMLAIQQRLGEHSDIQQKMSSNSPFVERVCIDWKTCFIASFLPQFNDNGILIAYILAISPLADHKQNLLGMLTVFSLGVFLFGLITLTSLKTLQTSRLNRAINQQLSDGLYVINPQGNITDVNPRACEILGYTKHELMGQNAHQLFHSKVNHQDPKNQTCSIQQAIFHGKSYRSSKMFFRHKDGSDIPIELSSSPILIEERITSSVTLFRDTKQRQSEKRRLREVNAAFMHAAEGIIITDAEQNILSVNPAFSQITGFDADEVIGKKPHVFSSGLQNALFYQALWHELNTKFHWQGELINRNKAGHLYTEHLSITAVKDEDGTLTNYTAVFSDISTIKEKEQRLQHNALHDTLTGLPNRAHLIDKITQALKHAPQEHKLIALLFIDLDRFKAINDSLGHEIGDVLLQEVAARMRLCLEPSHLLARQGGDEFVVLMQNITQSEDTLQVASCIIETLKQDFHLAQHAIYIGSSIGISIFPYHGIDATTLLRHADMAMYEAKAEGGNRYKFYETQGEDIAHERLLLEAELRLAILGNQLRLYYQPKLQLSDQRIVSFEALVRWQHPTRGLMSPDKFLPLIRTANLNHDLGRWVIRQGLKQLANWQTTLGNKSDHALIYLNLEGENLADDDLSDFIFQELERFAIPAHCLGIEVTETTFSKHAEKIIATLHRLNIEGIKIAIDDFGTGHSSLQRLKSLPVNQLKIDASFVRGILDDPDDRRIVQSIIGLAHELQLDVVAEGVENQAQVDLLANMGCDQLQGYFIAKPLPPKEAILIVRRGV